MSETVKDYPAQIPTTANPQPFNADGLREEATRVLQHSLFSNSERCSKLLRYLVAVSLKNHSTPLKERTIGHDVFGREPGYDTYGDPIVRNAASEVRRRLKRYYETVPKDHPRIELPTGQYLVVLQSPNHPGSHVSINPNQAPEKTDPDPPEEHQPPLRTAFEPVRQPGLRDRRNFLYGLAAALGAPALLWGGFELGRRNPIISDDPFWNPIVHHASSILLSVGSDKTLGLQTEGNREARDFPEPNSAALARVAARLAHYNALFRVLADVTTTMSDIEDGVPVLIGQMTHPWIQRILPELPFQSGQDESRGAAWIQDTKNPNRRWSIQIPQARTGSSTDYAIVARLRSQLTGGTVVVLSGLGNEVTPAAAEFVTRDSYLSSFGRGWSDPNQNVEFVLSTTVVDGVSGPPELIAQAVW